MGKDWHPECFQCTDCRIPLSPDNFYEKNGKPYCENDYYKRFAPKCYGCTKPIKGKVCVFTYGRPRDLESKKPEFQFITKKLL